jgi:fatty acid desaturase
MKSLPAITDPDHVLVSDTTLTRFFKSFVRDERDVCFIYVTLRITFILLPLAVLLYLPFVPGWLWWMIAGIYLFYNNSIKSRFGLMSHCTAHRPWFKEKYRFLNNYFSWVLGPFFGQSPETYYSHHIAMHHPENNLDDDISSTMHYQRDSPKDFLKYWSNFFFLGLIQLSKYFIRKKRKEFFYRIFIGELLFFVLCIGLCFVNWQATVVVFIIPFFASRIVMMIGNWVQHAFVSVEEPGNEYKNSITCINTRFNHRCWNDGYHASHHIRSAIHWTEHPEYFRSTINEFEKNSAIVFDGIDYGNVFFWLMRKRYDLLAKNFVNLGNRFTSDEEVISLLKLRTRKIPAQ